MIYDQRRWGRVRPLGQSIGVTHVWYGSEDHSAPAELIRTTAPNERFTARQHIGDEVTVVGMDRDGNVRIRVPLAREDRSLWFVKVIRRWLAWWSSPALMVLP